jgi:YgiT-type zinc finger domain-containing protein
MIYRTSRCPNCKHVVSQTAGYDTDLYIHIGNPVDQCPHCGVRYLTGRKYWVEMQSVERRKIYALLWAGLLLGGLKIAVIVMLVMGFSLSAIVEFGGYQWPEAALYDNTPLLVMVAIVVLLGSYIFSIRSHLGAFTALKKLGDPDLK